MEKIRVNVDWCDENFAAVTEDDRLCGMVLVTAATYDELLKDLREAICEHVKGVVADGEMVPEWLKEGLYELDIVTPA